MIANDFAEFVSSQQTALANERGSWGAILEEWLRDLEGLYESVIGFLVEYVDRGSISYSFDPITVIEEDLGAYTAKKMEIRIGRQHIYLEPVGTLLIGCKGRVDLVGSMGRVPIFLVGKGVIGASDLIRVTVTHLDGEQVAGASALQDPKSWAWKTVSHTVPRRFVELDRDTFLKAVMEVANG